MPQIFCANLACSARLAEPLGLPQLDPQAAMGDGRRGGRERQAGGLGQTCIRGDHAYAPALEPLRQDLPDAGIERFERAHFADPPAIGRVDEDEAGNAFWWGCERRDGPLFETCDRCDAGPLRIAASARNGAGISVAPVKAQRAVWGFAPAPILAGRGPPCGIMAGKLLKAKAALRSAVRRLAI